MKLSQSNFKLRSPDSDSVRSYLIITIYDFPCFYQLAVNEEKKILVFRKHTPLLTTPLRNELICPKNVGA